MPVRAANLSPSLAARLGVTQTPQPDKWKANTGTPAVLAWQCAQIGLPEAILEWRFHSTRRWRFDLAWTDKKLAVEVDGGAWVKGRHNRGQGYRSDCIKLAEAAILGWRVIRVMPEHVASGAAVTWIERALSP